MTSRHDAQRAAVAPLFAELRGELLVAPREEIVERHLDMMAFEQQVLATPRFDDANKPRRIMRRPRRAAIVFTAICSTLVSCGLSAAGALPEPLQQITDKIAHTLGVPETDRAQNAPEESTSDTPASDAPTTATTPRPAPNPSTAPATDGPTKSASNPPSSTPTYTPPPTFTDSTTPIAETPAHPPAQPITPVDTDPPPSTNSSNTPPGYPTDWRTRAADAAAARLTACTQVNALTQAGCPQQVMPANGTQVQSVRWTQLNTSQVGAVVLAKTHLGNPAKHIPPKTTVTVYEAFQMSVTYTAADGSGPYLGYSSGVGMATMTWNGSAFDNVSFTVGSVTDSLPAGIAAPTIPERTNVDNGIVLSTLQAGFDVCTVGTPVADDPIPSCPQPTVAGAHWTSVGNPTQGAVVTYDARTGLYTVTGNYAMTSDLGDSVSGPYTATLFFDNFRVWVLNISAT